MGINFFTYFVNNSTDATFYGLAARVQSIRINIFMVNTQ